MRQHGPPIGAGDLGHQPRVAARTEGQRPRDPPVDLVERIQWPEHERRRSQPLLAHLPRQAGADVANARLEMVIHAGGNVSFTSAMDTDGMTLMNARNSRKKKPKLPMVIVE